MWYFIVEAYRPENMQLVDAIKRKLKEIGWRVDWTHLAHDITNWRVPVTSWATEKLCRLKLLTYRPFFWQFFSSRHASYAMLHISQQRVTDKVTLQSRIKLPSVLRLTLPCASEQVWREPITRPLPASSDTYGAIVIVVLCMCLHIYTHIHIRICVFSCRCQLPWQASEPCTAMLHSAMLNKLNTLLSNGMP